MSTVDKLFSKQMTWPRLVVKSFVEGIIAYNCYDYNSAHKPAWDCYASGFKQPNGTGDGENVSDQFTSVIQMGMILALIGVCTSVVEMINKKVQNK